MTSRRGSLLRSPSADVRSTDDVIAFERPACGDAIENIDQGGYTPLLLAVQRGYPEVVRLLAMHGGDLQAKTLRHNNGVEELAHPDVAVLVKRIAGMSPIDIAADAGLVDHVHRLVPEATTSSLKNAKAVVQRCLDAAEQAAALARGTTVRGGGEGHSDDDDDDGGGGGAAAVTEGVVVSAAANGSADGSAGSPHASGGAVVERDEDKLAIRRLLAMAIQSWAPCRHELFGMTDRRTVWALVLVTYRLANCEHLPHLPQEMWFAILSFIGRSADHGSAAAAAATATAAIALPEPAQREAVVAEEEAAADQPAAMVQGGQASGAPAAAGVGLDSAAGAEADAPRSPKRTASSSTPNTPWLTSPPTPSALSLLLAPPGSNEKSRSVWRSRHLLRKVAASKKSRRQSWASSGGAWSSTATAAVTDESPWLCMSGTDDELDEGKEVMDTLVADLGQARQELFP